MSLIPAKEAYNQSIEVCNKSSEDFMEEVEKKIDKCIKKGNTSLSIFVDYKVSDDALNNVVNKLKELHYDVHIDNCLSVPVLDISFQPKKNEKQSWIKRIFGE